MKRALWAGSWLAVLVMSCASAPRPPILSQADSVSQTPAAREARELAPQAFAEAELLRKQAAEAHEAGDRPGAQVLGEHALAGYGHAFVLARMAKAEQRLSQAELALAKAKTELAALDEKQRFVAAEADDLEKRVRVLKDALPLAPNLPASPEREKARLEAARAMASQARLLCMAARLLDTSAAGLGETSGQLDALDKQLEKNAAPVPIDEAVRLRSACLRQLTNVRRKASAKAPGEGRADALLAELSRTGELLPVRDDRGVVIVLRGDLGAAQLPKDLAERIALLGRVAKAHPDFPLLVVVHAAKGRGSAEDEKRAKRVADALRQAGAPKVETHSAGGAQPIVAPDKAGAPARNQRIEIVFVAPSH